MSAAAAANTRARRRMSLSRSAIGPAALSSSASGPNADVDALCAPRVQVKWRCSTLPKGLQRAPRRCPLRRRLPSPTDPVPHRSARGHIRPARIDSRELGCPQRLPIDPREQLHGTRDPIMSAGLRGPLHLAAQKPRNKLPLQAIERRHALLRLRCGRIGLRSWSCIDGLWAAVRGASKHRRRATR